MKFILFCLNDYSFSILNPIKEVLVKRNYNFIWYVAPKLKNKFPFKNDKFTSSYRKLKSYKSDVIFAPGNEVPFFLRGLKTQIFHGLAGEKKGHFRIRDYFDLYLTQGPYFTNRFLELKKKHKNFDVIETVKQIENKFSWVKDPIRVSILGCVVNGPGEAMHTDIGVTGGGNNNHQIYIDGKKKFISKNKNLVEEISNLITEKLNKNG